MDESCLRPHAAGAVPIEALLTQKRCWDCKETTGSTYIFAPSHPSARGMSGIQASSAVFVLLWVASLVGASMLAAAATPGPTVRPFASWLPYGTMTLDSRGVPHLAWVSSGTVMTATLDRSTGTLTQLQPVAGAASSFGHAGFLAMASAGPRLFVLWSQDSPGGGVNRAVVAFSEDGGAHFMGPIVLPADDLYDLSAAGDAAGNLYVAWYDGRGGSGPYPFSTRFAVLPAGSASFSTPLVLAVDHVGDPTIAVDQNRVYVAWAWTYNPESFVYVRTSQDQGATFGQPVTVAPTDNATKFSVTVVAGGGVAYVIWQYVVSLKVAYALSVDGGVTFSSARPWSSNLTGFEYGPDGAFYGIVAVPTAITRVLPGQENGTRIETGAPTFPDSWPYLIVTPSLAVDAAGHYFFLFTLEKVLVMTGSQYQSEQWTYLVTDLPLKGTPFPITETVIATAAGFLGAVGLARASLYRRTRGRPRAELASGRPRSVLRQVAEGLGFVEAQAGRRRTWPLVASVMSLAGAALTVVMGVLYYVALGGVNVFFGPSGSWV